MQFKNENAMSSTTLEATATNISTSSTDSGVIINDRNSTNNCNSNNNKTTVESDVKYVNETIQNAKLNNDLKNLRKSDEYNACSNKINLENIRNTNLAKAQFVDKETENKNLEEQEQQQHEESQDQLKEMWQQQSCSSPTTKFIRPASRNCSPSVSIRSTTISIVSIDENALDSSVVDSSSEAGDDDECETEAIHKNYIIKKLGQQTTLPPDSPDLPNINQGMSVISQNISQNGMTPSTLAENILNGNAGLCVPPTPSSATQIGSIALSNSTDVTFGDKHFYEGPVTIQQFLIDARDKYKPIDEDGQDNPMYTHEPNNGDATLKVNNQPTPSEQPYNKVLFNRKAVIITGAIIVLTLIIGILILTTSNIFKSSIRKTIDDGTLQLVNRKEWGGRAEKVELDKLKLPVHRVIISHTASDTCDALDVCSYRLRVIQSFHMDSQGWDDIGYNFLIGGDGRVYVGRGWDNQGAHTKGYNVDSIGITFIGTFTTTKPPERQLKALQLLMLEGVKLKKLVEDYRLYGHRQFSASESPGDALFNILKTWPHFSHT